MRRLSPAVLTYPVLLSVMVHIGLRFPELSNGLASPDWSHERGGPFFCRDLLSSGGDDDAMITAFTLFALPLALRLIRWNRDVNGVEMMLFLIVAAVVLLALGLAGMDCAGILYTAFIVPDLWLATALLSLPLATLSLLVQRSAAK